MRIARIIGTVTLNRWHPTFLGATLKLARPLSLADLRNAEAGKAEELVVYDEYGAGVGSQIMLSEGGEAAQPFWPDSKPVDAYNAGIIDDLHLSD